MVKKKKAYSLQARTRGGISIRKQWSRITSDLKSPHKCPSCTSMNLKRQSVGIWQCSKCGYQFAGGAYIPSTKLGQTSTRTR